jgi:NADPH-dependent methylglyoxal reductase
MALTQAVLLTGATGSLGSVILEQLLDNGYLVTAVLRSFQRSKSYLEHKYDKEVADHKLQFVEIPDMTVSNAFQGATQGVAAIIHVATPLAKDNFVEAMIKPGNLIIDNILRAATHSTTIKRVIVTGSIVETFNSLHFMEGPKTITEADFNDITLDDALKKVSLAYTYSKTSAECRAWEYMHQSPRSFDLIFLLAPSIFGRSIQAGFKAVKGDLGGIAAIFRELFDRGSLGFLFPYIM